MKTLQTNAVQQLITLLIASLFFNIQNIYADTPACYNLIWSDEFSGNTLDETKWQYYTWGWNSSEVQSCYRQENVTVNNGTLKLTAMHEPGVTCSSGSNFSSGFVQTRDKAFWTYGYFEARIKLPASDSTWPAFWMSPQNSEYGEWPRSGEIDIFEVKGHDMSRSYGNAHWGNSGDDKQQDKGTYTFPAGSQADNWHVYAVEWQEGELKFYIDDVHYHTINNFDEPNATTHPGPFNIDFYLRLNVAVGGTYLDEPYNDAYNDLGQLPADMEVDWVRVYQKDNNCNPDPEPIECNLIQNPDFSTGQVSWQTYISSSANASLSTNAGYADYTITNGSTSKYKVQLYQTGFLLEQGKTYEVSFLAKADANKAIYVQFSDQSDPPTQYHYEPFDIGANWATQSFTFTMNNTTNNDTRMSFGVGENAIDVAFDNVVLNEQNCLLGCTDEDACNYNPDATIDDASCEAPCPPPNTCNSNARYMNQAKVKAIGSFAKFAETSLTNNFVKAEKAYIKHQKEIYRILNSKEKRYAKVNDDFVAVKAKAINLVFDAFTNLNYSTISSNDIQVFDKFLVNLCKAAQTQSLKDEIEYTRKYIQVMQNKAVKQALIAFDKAKEIDIENNIMENKLNDLSGLDAFPNPFDNKLSIDLSNFEISTGVISLYNVKGKLVNEQPFNNTELIEIETKVQLPGMYIIQIRSKDSVYSKKLLKQ